MPTPPGPRMPAIAQAVRYLRDPIGFLRRTGERYGDTFTIRLPGLGKLTYVGDPDAAKELLTGDTEVLLAGAGNAKWLEPVTGAASVFSLDGPAHLRQRKLLLPPFHGKHVLSYEAIIREATEREMDGWPLGEAFATRPAMQRITLEVIQRAVMGVEDPARREQIGERILHLEETASRVLPLPPLRRDLGRFSPWNRFLRARAAADELIFEEIAKRRTDPDIEERNDVVSLLIRARHEDGSSMTDRELRDQVMSTIAAGYETTATSLSWAWERSLRTPHVHARLRDDPDDDYLDALSREILRLRLPVTDGGTRVAARDTDIGGYTIKKGSAVLAAPYLIHFRPDVYPDPDEFRPERFLGDKPPPYTWVPFGGGVRRCLGASLAHLEMRVVMRTVLQRAELEAPSPQPEPARMHHVVVVPARGGQAVVRRWKDPAARSGEPLVAQGSS